MNIVIGLLLAALASWLILGGIFFAYPTVQRLKDRRDEFGWIVKVPIYVWLGIGVTSDVVFNVTWGSVIVCELPREWLFTDRLKRHWRGSDEQQKERAAPWVRRVNAIDPGHV